MVLFQLFMDLMRMTYNNFAPPNSFIHINKFNRNMNQLANYLQADSFEF